MLSDQGKRPLFQAKLGAFFYADFGPLGMTPVRSEYGNVGIDPKRIIAPVAGRHHSPVKIENPGKLPAVEAGNPAPVPMRRERRDDAQALFAFG